MPIANLKASQVSGVATVTTTGETAALVSGTKQPETAKTFFTKEDCADPGKLQAKLQLFVDQVNRELAIAKAFPFLGGMLLKEVSFSSGVSKTLQHSLGRPVKWYLPIRTAEAAYQMPKLTLISSDNTTVVLRADVTAVADVYVVAE